MINISLNFYNNNISSRHFPCGVNRVTLSSGTRCIQIIRWRTAHRRSQSTLTLISHVWAVTWTFIVHYFEKRSLVHGKARGKSSDLRNLSQPFAHLANNVSPNLNYYHGTWQRVCLNWKVLLLHYTVIIVSNKAVLVFTLLAKYRNNSL